MLRPALLEQGLSPAEVNVAELITKGISNKEAADKLFVTEKTIKFHLTSIYKKMKLKSRAQLIVWAIPHMTFAEKATVGESGGAGGSAQVSPKDALPGYAAA